VYGAIVIEPREAAHPPVRDLVLLLSDWSDRDPASLLATLKRQSDYYNYNQPTAIDFLRDVEQLGMRKALSKRRMWNQMRMSPTDLSDISGATYTYLCNGVGPAGNWTGVFTPGERVRLRIINGSSMTYFDVRIPGLKMTVVSADGQAVEPVTVDEFRLGVAETLDVMVQPGDAAWTVFAQAIDRSGYARATLAPRAGMQAAVPPMDPVPRLSMVDMMGAMAGMGGTTPHGQSMPGMPGMAASDAHPAHAMAGMSHPAAARAQDAFAFQRWQCHTGPSVDMCVPDPRTNLDDPGVGLRHNGRRVLSYADLRTIGGALDPRDPGRTLILHLTGNMERYIWGFDGKKYSEAPPIAFRYGERVRVTLINDTMMNHPIHLHGMWSELEAPDGSFQVRKHTITVQPAQQVSYLVNADAPGRWAYHCHMLYHMEAGMFREVVVA
jgi:CopA family copper-resistance protein